MQGTKNRSPRKLPSKTVLATLPPHHTKDEAAAELGLTMGTLDQWRSQGKGPPYLKFGGRIYYPRAEFETWVREQIRHPGRDPVRGNQTAKR